MILFFGLVSCSSDDNKNTNASSKSAFDFNLRVFSHDEGEQQLSSFGNSNLKLNDYIVLYNSGEILLPTWTLEQLKQYRIDGLQSTVVDVVCYGIDNQKYTKTIQLQKSYFRVTETLPDSILLNDKNEVTCEYAVTGQHRSGSKLSVLKMVTVLMDTSKEFKIFSDIESDRIHISSNEFAHILQQKDLLQTERLDLICIIPGGFVSQDTILSADTPSLQKVSLPSERLLAAQVCRLRSQYQGDTYLSEIFIFKSNDIKVVHTNFRTFYPRENNDLFYTFQITNMSSKIYELKISPDKMELSLEHFPGGLTAPVYKMKINLSGSKPMLTENISTSSQREYGNLYKIERWLGD